MTDQEQINELRDALYELLRVLNAVEQEEPLNDIMLAHARQHARVAA